MPDVRAVQSLGVQEERSKIVVILRAHYSMDVFTGIIVALWVSNVCDQISPRLDRLLSRAPRAST